MKKTFIILSIALLIQLSAFSAQTTVQKQIQIARTFIENLSAKNFNAAYNFFNKKVSEALPESKLSAIWQSLENNFGKYENIAEIKNFENKGYEIVIIKTKFEKGYLDMQVAVDANYKIAGFWIKPSEAPKYTLPDYVNTNKFTVKKVQIGKFKLPGELTIPKGKGPFPGIILISGSGPSDMDESIGANKPFKDLAYGLSTMGIVVLRYDKRTYVYGKEVKPANAKNVYLEDANSAINFMKSLPYVKDIFVLGHSLGAYLAPEIAYKNKDIKGIIMLAAPARSMATISIEQLEYIKSLTKDQSEKDKINKIIEKLKLIEEHKMKDSEYVMGAPASYYYNLNKYSPTKILKNFTKKVLICQGGKDYQVSKKDFDIFKNMFASNKLFTFKWYPSLSHIFTPVTGIPSPSNYQEASHVDKKVIDDIITWIK
jgi:hypothetical protein